MVDMNRYDNYKDSGVKWMGKIPNHWKCIRIRHLLRERTIKSTDGIGEPLSMSQKYGIILSSQMDVIPNGATSYIGAKHTYKGDLVLNKLKAHLGVFAISSYNGLVSPDYAVYYGTKMVDLEYLEYLFKTPMYITEFIKKTTGVAIGFNRLYTDDLFSISSHYPPLSEQTAIASYLKDKTSKIEQYVTERERELLESLKQSEIANVVTKGLNPNVPMKDSGIPWIGMIPKHWEVKKIKFLFKERSEKGFPNEPVLCSTQKYGVIPQDMYENRVVVVNKGLEGLKLVEVGDFIISLRSFQGGIEYAYYQGIISAAYTVLTPSKEINSQYIKYLFKSHPFIELLKTCVTGIREGQNINYGMLRKNSIMLPPLSEQQAIVSYIEDKLQKIDTCITDLQAEINYLKEFKQRLISDVVTGQICVAEPQKGGLQ
ncbi:restriction endonuclease subunit S [Bacteroides fragilis]|uniref:restriction endonuclease subunit S n=1 Tax=Bacteroides fragilis TaxID=817 RepID=UPI002091D9B7|nr:restriction endonuclease subunit S [Bacteroides fragilis]